MQITGQAQHLLICTKIEKDGRVVDSKQCGPLLAAQVSLISGRGDRPLWASIKQVSCVALSGGRGIHGVARLLGFLCAGRFARLEQ